MMPDGDFPLDRTIRRIRRRAQVAIRQPMPTRTPAIWPSTDCPGASCWSPSGSPSPCWPRWSRRPPWSPRSPWSPRRSSPPGRDDQPAAPGRPAVGGPLQRQHRVVVRLHHRARGAAPGVSPIALAVQAPTTPRPRGRPPHDRPPATPAPPARAHRARHHRPAAGPGELGRPDDHGRADHHHGWSRPPPRSRRRPPPRRRPTPTTAGADHHATLLLTTTTQSPTDGALLAPLLGLLYLLRAHLPAPGRHARPGRYRLPQVRSRRASRRPPRRARTRP